MEQKESKAWGKREAKIIVTLFFIVVALLVFMNAWEAFAPSFFGNDLAVEDGGQCGLIYFRNRRIDKLEPQTENSPSGSYGEEEIKSAVECVKEEFKSRKNNIGLLSVLFDEEKSGEFLEDYHATKEYGKENMIVIFCDMTVYDGEGLSRGTYRDWAMILARKNSSSQWELLDEGY